MPRAMSSLRSKVAKKILPFRPALSIAFSDGLADVHDRAEFLALLGRAGVDGDQRDLLVGDLLDRALEHVVVGDRGDDAVVVLRRGLLDQARHVGQVAARRVAVVDGDVEVLAGLLDRVLDRVPPGIGVRRVTDEHVLVGRMRGAHRR